MARENQGLQIALIVSVMLAVILAVTTFIFYRQYDDANTKAKAAQKDAEEKGKLAASKSEEAGFLKKKIGFPETDEMQAIDPQINQDMQTYASTFPEETRVYRQVVAQLSKSLQEKNAALAASQAEVQTLKEEYKGREASKEPQIKQFEEGQKKAAQDLAEEHGKFNSDRQRLAATESDLQTQLQKSRKDAEATVAKVQGEFQNLEKQYANQRRQLTATSQKLEDVTKQNPDTFDGEITWVDQHTGSVWINVGRADALPRQTSFSVYTQNVTEVAKAGKKASIEVTEIVGDHMAQAKIVDDKPADPILIGDKIYTPIWSPGQRRHFALAGIMDVKGDGRNNQKLLHDLIVLNGGVVDCETDPKGEVQGEITANTRYLILGDPPSIGKGKEAPPSLTGFTTITTEAEKHRLQTIPLGDLLQQMGWKNQTPLVRYGPGANPADFRAKPDARANYNPAPVPGGSFKPRTPPQPGTTANF